MKRMISIKSKMSRLALAVVAGLLVNLPAMAAETPEVPWRNIAVSDDGTLFWLLTGIGVLLLILIAVIGGAIKTLASSKQLWLKSGSAKVIGLIAVVSLSLTGTDVFAQTGGGGSSPIVAMNDDIFWLLVFIDVVLLVILFSLIFILRSMLQTLKGRREEALYEEPEEDLWTGAFNKAVPVEREEEIMLEHEHDGIRELDNTLPPWWVWMFYVTIIFGVVYMVHFHVKSMPVVDVLLGPGVSQEELYEMEMAAAEKALEERKATAVSSIDESNVTMVESDNALAEGKQIYNINCAACHGQKGEGGVGPNLADKYWIHGGGIQNVYETIKNGVPQKGMIPWKDQLTPVQIRNVSSYVLTEFPGTNPPGAKEPQGEIWEPKAEEKAPADTTAAAEAPADTTAAE